MHHEPAKLGRRGVLGAAIAGSVAGSRLFAQPRANGPAPRWMVTTERAGWQPGELVAVQPADPAAMPDVIVDQTATQQAMEGIGACFNEMGWDALQALAPADRDAVMGELFGDGGAGFTFCRMPIGANDFSRDWYSYDEEDGDFALRRFSIARDETGLIPFIKAAQRVRPDLRLWASPWSPPTWMKTNRHYAAAAALPGFPNGLRPDQAGREGTDMFLAEDRYFEAYARYFGRFVDAYRARGIPIGMVMPQNEFNSAQPFPSCCWTPAGLARFLPWLGREMGPRGVSIFFGTLERANDGLFEQVYADAAAAVTVRGIGAQWAGKGAVAALRRAHPTLPVYQTEQECGDGRNDWRYCRYAWSLMKQYLQNGASAYFYWNIALPAGGVSRWGWAQNSLVTVDRTGRSFRYNHEYWLMKHLATSARPGARRIAVNSWRGYEDVLAFRDGDGTLAILAHNPLATPMPIAISLGGRTIRATLPADSFASARLPAAFIGA